MIPRYSPPEIAELFTDEARFAAWLEVEVLAVEAWAELGVVPAEHARTVRERAGFDVAAVHEREQVTDHDVAAFVDVVQARVGAPAGGWVHYGLTSSDVVDTALALQMTRALDVILPAVARLEEAIAARAREFRDTPMVGRTHGIHAEPTTFGVKLALWAMQVRRDRERLLARARCIAVGKLSGAVGTYSNVDPYVEEYVCRAPRAPAGPGDASARSRPPRGSDVRVHVARSHDRVVRGRGPSPAAHRGPRGRGALPRGRAKGLERDAAQAEPGEVRAVVRAGRVLRGNLQAAFEDVALWHERDISHSSVERVIVPDSLMLAYYMTVRFTKIVAELRVYPDRMLRNIDASFGLVFSQPVLLALVEAGKSRDDAYRIVQRNAMRAWQEERSFREILGEDPDVTDVLDAARLDAVLRPEARALQHRPRVRRARRGGKLGALTGRPTSLPHLYTGKVRELYEVSHDRMLMVASDRVSVFDVVLPDQIPDKGRVLTGLSHFWFERTREIVENHVISADPTDFPETAGDVAGRATLVRVLAPDPARVRGARLPVRRRLAGVPRPGHRRRLLRARRAAPGRAIAGAAVHTDDQGGVGSRRPADARRSHRSGRRRALRSAARRSRCGSTSSAPRSRDDCGVILADTKFEFGEIDDRDPRHRRDDDARFVALLAGRGLRASAVRRRRSTSSTCATSWTRPAGTTNRRRPTCRPRRSRTPGRVYREAYELITGESLDDWFGPDDA